MYNVTITPNSKVTAPTGSHDSHIIQFSTAKRSADSTRTNVEYNLLDFKQLLLDKAQRTISTKDDVDGLAQSTFVDMQDRQLIWDLLSTQRQQEIIKDRPNFNPTKTNSKLEDFALSRCLIALDFDTKPNLQQILQILDKEHLAYFGSTTYSHNITDNRYRIIIPFTSSYTVDEWHKDTRARLKQYFSSIGISTLSQSPNKLDNTCFTFSQYGKFPAINPKFGSVNLFFKDDAGTHLLDVDSLPAPIAVPSTITTSVSVLPTLCPKNTQILANAITSKVRNLRHDELFGLALGLVRLGIDNNTIDYILHQVKDPTSTTKIGPTINDAHKKANTGYKPHAVSLLLSKLDYHTKVILGYVDTQNTKQYTHATWDKEIFINYLKLSDFSKEKRVLINADMNSGKTKCYQMSNQKYFMLVPLKSIYKQANSKNKIKEDSILTYDKSKQLITAIETLKMNPRQYTLIIDECHNLLCASYRLQALENVRKLVKFPWKKIIFQSATIHPDSFDGLFEFDIKIRAKKIVPLILNYSNKYKPSKTKEIIGNIVEYYALNSTNPTLVLWNNEKYLLSLQETLNSIGVRSEVITSSSVDKVGSIASDLANNPDFKLSDHGIQFLLGTTSLVEGLNIRDELDVANAIIVNSGDHREPVPYIKQLCGRWRNTKSVNCLHLGNFYDQDDDIQELTNNAIKHSVEQQQLMQTIKDWIYNFGITNNRSPNYADFTISYPMIKPHEHGVYFDESKQELLITPYHNLFAKHSVETFMFYSSSIYRNAVLTALDFNVQVINNFIGEESLSKLADDSIKASQQKEKARRELLYKQFISHFDATYDEPTFIYDKETQHVMKNDTNYSDPFHQELLQLWSSVNFLTYKEAKAQIFERLVKNHSAEKIVYEVLSFGSDFGIKADLRRRNPHGTTLDVVQQNAELAFIIQSQMKLFQATFNYDDETAFEHVKSFWSLKKDDNVTIILGKVFCNFQKPIYKLMNYLDDYVPTKVRINGKPTKVIRVIDANISTKPIIVNTVVPMPVINMPVLQSTINVPTTNIQTDNIIELEPVPQLSKHQMLLNNINNLGI